MALNTEKLHPDKIVSNPAQSRKKTVTINYVLEDVRSTSENWLISFCKVRTILAEVSCCVSSSLCVYIKIRCAACCCCCNSSVSGCLCNRYASRKSLLIRLRCDDFLNKRFGTTKATCTACASVAGTTSYNTRHGKLNINCLEAARREKTALPESRSDLRNLFTLLLIGLFNVFFQRHSHGWSTRFRRVNI